jgi:hypothetical protein
MFGIYTSLTATKNNCILKLPAFRVCAVIIDVQVEVLRTGKSADKAGIMRSCGKVSQLQSPKASGSLRAGGERNSIGSSRRGGVLGRKDVDAFGRSIVLWGSFARLLATGSPKGCASKLRNLILRRRHYSLSVLDIMKVLDPDPLQSQWRPR